MCALYKQLRARFNILRQYHHLHDIALTVCVHSHMSTHSGLQCFSAALKCNFCDYEEVEQFLCYISVLANIKRCSETLAALAINYLLPLALLNSLQFKWSKPSDSRRNCFGQQFDTIFLRSLGH